MRVCKGVFDQVLNASAAASHNIDNGNAARSYQTEFGVSYEVDLWQKLRNAANAQEWEYKATMEDREAARLALVNSVADTYFELKYLDESIKVMDASVKRYQELLRLIEAKYEFGKVASVEPLQAQQSLLSARNSLLDLEDRQNVARQTLRDLLNIRPGENPAIGNADLMWGTGLFWWPFILITPGLCLVFSLICTLVERFAPQVNRALTKLGGCTLELYAIHALLLQFANAAIADGYIQGSNLFWAALALVSIVLAVLLAKATACLSVYLQRRNACTTH